MGRVKGYHHSKIRCAIFSEIIDNGGLIKNLSNFKTHILGADSQRVQSLKMELQKVRMILVFQLVGVHLIHSETGGAGCFTLT